MYRYIDRDWRYIELLFPSDESCSLSKLKELAERKWFSREQSDLIYAKGLFVHTELFIHSLDCCNDPKCKYLVKI